MPKPARTIASLFHVPERFVRSVQLERDFDDPLALEDYIATPAIASAFAQIVEGMRPGAGRRAWRVTGDYGVGKSSFALVTAQMLARGAEDRSGRLAAGLGWEPGGSRLPRLWPILLTGSRGPLIPAIADAIAAAIAARRPARGRVPKVHAEAIALAEEISRTGSQEGLEVLLLQVLALAAEKGEGVLLVIDELGKFLEHAAQSGGSEDVFVLQRMAEIAARSGKRPFLLMTLLHQGFHSYAERLPLATRNEWEKVAGRFEEIVFDQPLAHTAALVAEALRLDTARLPTPVRAAAREIARSTAGMGWLSGGTLGAANLDIARLYPLHPTILPVLVRFFARFGQHERSLFGFLLSGEPFGLQSFAAQPVAPDRWYRLDDLYDYVRACFGHRLAGASYRSHWLRIIGTIDSAEVASDLELRLLKAIAVLNLIDAEDLLPTDRALAACFTPCEHAAIEQALGALTDRGTLFRRGTAGGYRLWPNASVNLEAALALAERALGETSTVADALIPFLPAEPIMARRHYLETGTLRYFELRYCSSDDLLVAAAKPTSADGILLVALSDDGIAAEKARTAAAALAERETVVVCVPPPCTALSGDLTDLLLWSWVAQNTPELAEDAFSSSEVSRQIAAARRNLLSRAEQSMGLRNANPHAHCYWKGERIAPRLLARGASGALSKICDRLYRKAPRIANELINRNALSTPAASARMRLIERLYLSSEDALLGLDPQKAPPEKSIYLSLLAAGGIHVETDGSYSIVLPEKHDPLQLGMTLRALRDRIRDGRGDRIAVPELFEHLRRPPYGVRDGVLPLLLAVLLRTNAHEFAVYEHGTFLHRFGPPDLQRLIKSAQYFDIQHCQISGVRLEVFDALVRSFADGRQAQPAELLDVVRPLCHFAAQLPVYTQRTSGLSPVALSVRDALLAAREPLTLLFSDLPAACGYDSFMPEQAADGKVARAFALQLQDVIEELRHAYEALLDRIIAQVARVLGQDGGFDRVSLAGRAARVSLAAREPRLRTFALRLRDPGLSDHGWAEALASYVVAKPPSKWLANDEARFLEEAGALAELFAKCEAAAFSHPDAPPRPDAMRLNVTRGDGEDLVCIVEPGEGDDVADEVARFAGRLPRDTALRRQVLAELLLRELRAGPSETGRPSDAGDAGRGVA